MVKKRWSDDLLPIGRLVKRGAIFRRASMDGVIEREIKMGKEHYRIHDVFDMQVQHQVYNCN